MIVEELLIQLGFEDGGADKRITSLRNSIIGLASAIGAGAMFSRLAEEANKAVDASRALSRQLGAIEALMPGETAALAGMADTIQSLAVKFGRSTAEIGKGMEASVQSFNDARSATDALELSVKTAAASGAQTEDALRLLSAVTKAYGDTSAKTQKQVADLGQQTVLIGDVQMGELANSIGRVTPMASTLGVSLKELFAVFAASTGPLGGASEVSTQFASVLRGLLDRTPEMDKAFKKAFAGTGIKTMQQALGKHGMRGVLQALVQQTDGTAEGIQKLFGRAEATNLALFLTQKGSATAARAERELAGAAGAVDRAFAAQTQGLGKAAFQADVLAAKYKVLQEQAGAKLEPTMGALSARAYEFAALATQVFVPATDSAVSVLGGATTATDDWRGALELLRDVLLSIAQVIDVVVAGMANIADAASFAAASTANFARNLFDRENVGLFRGQEEINRQINQSMTKRGESFRDRIGRRSADIGAQSGQAFIAPPPRQSGGLEDIRNDASRIASAARQFLQSRPGVGGALSGGVQVGSVQINVTVPDGTEAQAASRIGDVGVRVFLQQVLQQANAAMRPQTAPAGV